MKIIWAILIFALTNLKVGASANIVNCNVIDVPHETAVLDDDDDDYFEFRPPLYSYGICDTVMLGSGATLKLSKTNIKYILFENSHIGTIPPRVFQAYSSLEKIYINDNHVSEIDVNAFADLKNLQELYIQNNDIADIGKGIYNNLQNLQTLDISNNKIETIEGKALHGLVNLQNLNMGYNKIQNISFDIFDSELHSLHALDLSHNFLLEIDLKTISNLFSGNSKYSQIDLSYNTIKSLNFSQLTCNLNKLNLKSNKLSTLINLQYSETINELDLSDNNLSEFTYAPKNIKYLNLSGNLLTNLNISILYNKIEITTLDVSQNLIKYLSPNTFSNMSTLINLNLANNQLTELPIGVFKNVILLSSLNLSGNQLQEFEFGTFSGLGNLAELDISNNSFHSLDARAFYILENLIKLNIADNKLTTLNPYNILDHCVRLKVVILDNNPWICESLLKLYRVLKNHTVNIPDGQNLNIRNHLGHPCYKSENFLATENPVTEFNGLEKQIEIEFRNSSQDLEILNDYFNTDFKDTEFYKYFNRNFSSNYEASLRNFTDTLNLINSKFSQTDNNFEKLDQVVSEFSNFFNKGFKNSNFYEYFDKNFTNLLKNLNELNNFENSFYKFLLSRTTEASFDQPFFNQGFPSTEMLLSSNISYAKLTSDVVQEEQIASLSNIVIIIFMSFVTIFLFIITLLLFWFMKKFVNNRGKHTTINGELAELQLV